MNILFFILGAMFGGVIAIIVMACLNVSKSEDDSYNNENGNKNNKHGDEK